MVETLSSEFDCCGVAECRSGPGMRLSCCYTSRQCLRAASCLFDVYSNATDNRMSNRLRFNARCGRRDFAALVESHFQRMVSRGRASTVTTSMAFTFRQGFPVIASNSRAQASKIHAKSKANLFHFDNITLEVDVHMVRTYASQSREHHVRIDGTYDTAAAVSATVLGTVARRSIWRPLLSHGLRGKGGDASSLRVRDSFGTTFAKIKDLSQVHVDC